ncbi:MAG TPA: hypothetical protein PLH57_10285, partial [Oligoflexia bacterium]|nr:hypothetical protein [Oligoflexia bacterium]
MCFSANASFLASAGIGAVGAATLLKKPTIRELPLALIPVCFSVQQASEGIVWLTLPTGGLLHSVAVKVFLLFATMLWPVLVPIAFYLVEQDSSRRKKMRFGIGLGLAVVAYLLY